MQTLDIGRLKRCANGTCWDIGNKVFYDLCKKYPRHDNEEQILAKIWLIGRSYAAAIERRPQSASMTAGENFYEQTVGPAMRKARIDSWLEPLRAIKRPSHEKAPLILMAHKRLTDLFFDITGHEKRSLASKYLHFHIPNLFYLYDSRASRGIAALTYRVKETGNLREYDPIYARHFFRCLDLITRIEQEHRIYLSPRQLDDYLLNFRKKSAG